MAFSIVRMIQTSQTNEQINSVIQLKFICFCPLTWLAKHGQIGFLLMVSLLTMGNGNLYELVLDSLLLPCSYSLKQQTCSFDIADLYTVYYLKNKKKMLGYFKPSLGQK